MTPALLLDLARKYQTLSRWRSDESAGAERPSRTEFQRLASEFPGCLRELDRLSLEEIHARAAQLTRAADDPSAIVPWMRAVCLWHQWTRASLWIKRHRGTHDDLATRCRAVTGLEITERFVEQICSPPEGRSRAVVEAHVALVLGIDVNTLRSRLGL
ncbi:MAG: hypothetical protein Q8Q09_04210 [Deltaproteobacteria bacterium]|nr:hypothetical protein [Deltaproteobacteria bacterium]